MTYSLSNFLQDVKINDKLFEDNGIKSINNINELSNITGVDFYPLENLLKEYPDIKAFNLDEFKDKGIARFDLFELGLENAIKTASLNDTINLKSEIEQK